MKKKTIYGKNWFRINLALFISENDFKMSELEEAMVSRGVLELLSGVSMWVYAGIYERANTAWSRVKHTSQKA